LDIPVVKLGTDTLWQCRLVSNMWRLLRDQIITLTTFYLWRLNIFSRRTVSWNYLLRLLKE